MSQKNSWFLKSIVIGGVVGGLASLFHKQTRQHVGENAKGVYTESKDIAKILKNNPDKVKEQLQATSENMKTVFDDLKTEATNVAETYRDVKADKDSHKE